MTPKTFFFDGYSYDQERHVAVFRYNYGPNYQFEEKIIFKSTSGARPRKLKQNEQEVLTKILNLLYLASGISYFKIFFPENIVAKDIHLDKETAHFLNNFYTQGLGEYAFLNNLAIKGKINFPVSEKSKDQDNLGSQIKLPRKTAVPVGGGKDSIVTIELLKKSKEPLVLFIVGDAKPLFSTIKTANLPYIQVEREIDPKLFSSSKLGAKNGHIPITGLISLIATASSIVYGFDAIAMSNEQSANIGNIKYEGMEINHQYSKSLDFEKRLSKYIKKNFPMNLSYFSFLRPLSELAISKIFSSFPQYHLIFRSCGISYKQEKGKRLSGWCNNCAKCRFIFLSLAPFIEKNKLVSIFGKNLLADIQQIDGYRELVGIKGHKPFDCVGETSESMFAVSELLKSSSWQNDAIIKIIGKELKNKHLHSNSKKILGLSKNHAVSKRYLDILKNGLKILNFPAKIQKSRD
jgi:hypothetical protein